jgi:hypothetical protein
VTLAVQNLPSRAVSTAKPVMLVVHGPGRGKRRTFLPWVLNEIAVRPALRPLVHVYGTGTPRPSLDGFGAVVFMLIEPIENYPECEAEALALSAAARRLGIRVVNPPEALNNTIKSRQAAIWGKAGIPCAAAEPAADAAALREIIERIRYPVILRFDNGHLQKGVFVCKDKKAALEFLPRVTFPAVALQFINTRPSWVRAQPDSIMARYFHKKRSMVFPTEVLNNHVYFSSVPIVGSRTSTFGAAERGEPVKGLEQMLEADIGYSFAAPEAPKLMQTAVRALGLDVAAIDYSSFADGRIVLWEANASFALPRKGVLEEERRLDERVPRYVFAMIRYLEQLAGLAGPRLAGAGG